VSSDTDSALGDVELSVTGEGDCGEGGAGESCAQALSINVAHKNSINKIFFADITDTSILQNVFL